MSISSIVGKTLPNTPSLKSHSSSIDPYANQEEFETNLNAPLTEEEKAQGVTQPKEFSNDFKTAFIKGFNNQQFNNVKNYLERERTRAREIKEDYIDPYNK